MKMCPLVRTKDGCVHGQGEVPSATSWKIRRIGSIRIGVGADVAVERGMLTDDRGRAGADVRGMIDV